MKKKAFCDNTTPYFCWDMKGKQQGATPSAYQILLASTLDKLNEAEADLGISSACRYFGSWCYSADV